jgi:uncharacterized protein
MSNSRSITLYLAVAFGFAWLFWLLALLISKNIIGGPMVLLLFVGSFGPFIGAAVTTYFEGGLRQTAAFFRRGVDPRMGWSVFLVSFF